MLLLLPLPLRWPPALALALAPLALAPGTELHPTFPAAVGSSAAQPAFAAFEPGLECTLSARTTQRGGKREVATNVLAFSENCRCSAGGRLQQ